jgi:hypothetical protein
MYCLVRCIAQNDGVDTDLAAGTGDSTAGTPPTPAGSARADADSDPDIAGELDDEDLATLSAVATCLLGGGVL